MKIYRRQTIRVLLIVCIGVAAFYAMKSPDLAANNNHPAEWKREWPKTDFTRSTIDFSEVISGGPPKDGIPAIDDPQFVTASEVTHLDEREPVIVYEHKGDVRAYPFQVLMWHEIVNDVVSGRPVTVTYCPLCNTAIVFDRRLDGKVLDFGVSGKLRHSDMIMYDRQTESWWQQFNGEGIVGEFAERQLTILASLTVPFGKFKSDNPKGKVLVPDPRMKRRYGQNPYRGYDTSKQPFLFRGDYDEPLPPLAYVVSVEDQAWPLKKLREEQEIRKGNLVLRWHEGMASALDTSQIARGRDIGYVTVIEQSADGTEKAVPFLTTFAFAFRAFYPEGKLHID